MFVAGFHIGPCEGRCFHLRNKSQRVEPLVSLSSALNGVRVLLEAYEGYERARFLETDLAVREEVRRRTVMLQDHLTRLRTVPAKTVTVKRPRKRSEARRPSSPSARTSSSRFLAGQAAAMATSAACRAAREEIGQPRFAQPEDARHGHASGQRLA